VVRIDKTAQTRASATGPRRVGHRKCSVLSVRQDCSLLGGLPPMLAMDARSECSWNPLKADLPDSGPAQTHTAQVRRRRAVTRCEHGMSEVLAHDRQQPSRAVHMAWAPRRPAWRDRMSAYGSRCSCPCARPASSWGVIGAGAPRRHSHALAMRIAAFRCAICLLWASVALALVHAGPASMMQLWHMAQHSPPGLRLPLHAICCAFARPACRRHVPCPPSSYRI